MRYKILNIHPLFFIHISQHGTEKVRIIENSLPEDTKFIRSFTNDTSGWGSISLVIESESFEDLKEGDIIPSIPSPTFEKA